MADNAKDLLLAWLNDAYSMENGLVPILQNHANDAKDYPQVQGRIQQHVEETRRHAELVKGCIERRGGSVSTLKTGIGSLMGSVQSISTGAAQDQLVKNGLSDFAAEHLEIASYQALIAGAEEFGDRETVSVCQQILRDEEDMARWLAQNLPIVVRQTIQAVM